MPGMGNIQSMLNKMGMGNLGGLGGGKVNTGAMESQMNQRMKMAQMKERMRAKAEANAKGKAAATATAQEPTVSEEEILKIFSTGEKVERTPRGAKPSQPSGDKKKKKGKKQKIQELDPKNLSDYKKNLNFLLEGPIVMIGEGKNATPLLPNISHPDPNYRLTFKSNEMMPEDIYDWKTYGSLKDSLGCDYSETYGPSGIVGPKIGIETRLTSLTKKYYYMLEKLDNIKYSDRAEMLINLLEGELGLKGWNAKPSRSSSATAQRFIGQVSRPNFR